MSARRGSGTRERLLGAAARLIQKGGWRAATVAAIAVEAGVATGTLYRHFGSLAELFVQVLGAMAEREQEAMRRAADGRAEFGVRFDAVVTTYAGRALQGRALAWALVYEPVDPRVDAARLDHRRRYSRRMARLLDEGVAVGAIPPQPTGIAAAALVGAIAEALVGPLSQQARGGASDAETVAAIVGLCRRQIGLDAGAS